VARLRIHLYLRWLDLGECVAVSKPQGVHPKHTWSTSTASDEHRPQVLKSMEDVVRAARDTRPNTVLIRLGLTGLPGTPRSVTATMFTPCSNIASAAHQIAQLVALCRSSTLSKGDPNRCDIAAYHGSWERPDNGFADRFWRQLQRRRT
jgi:hypothetical protein